MEPNNIDNENEELNAPIKPGGHPMDLEPKTKTTSGKLIKDASQTSTGVGKVLGGLWDMAAGTTKGAWHSYTSVFNERGRNILGAGAISALVAYGVSQEELGAPSLGEVYAESKATFCELTNLCEGYSAEDRAEMDTLVNEATSPQPGS